MAWLLVVDNPARWDLRVPEVEVVAARDYLTRPAFAERRRLRVMNLCRSYSYQSNGYYVSLLAEARGHRPVPTVATIQDFKAPTILRTLSSDLDPLIQRALKPIQSEVFTLSVYFGRNLAKRHDPLARQLSVLFPAPLLRARFHRVDGRWQLENVSPLATSGVPETHREFLREAATDFFSRRHTTAKAKATSRFDLALLVDPTEANAPSDEGALRRFERAGERLGIRVQRITREDYGELAEYDGLFIRATTAVNHYTYRFARRAEAENMVVIDDPLSILRCTNKVFLQEILQRHHISTPATRILYRENSGEVMRALGLPCVLKQPDSSFSQGVVKAVNETDFKTKVDSLLEGSELLVAQEFKPTDFDWRIGLLDGEVVYACRYHMAKGHWQIRNQASRSQGNRDGEVDCVPVEDVPPDVIRTAVAAAALIGNGLYGVDMKEFDGRGVVIEVNDNPSIDAGIEDGLLGEGLYDRVMSSFLRRMEKKRSASS